MPGIGPGFSETAFARSAGHVAEVGHAVIRNPSAGDPMAMASLSGRESERGSLGSQYEGYRAL
jgi:hypothetical protein